MLNGQCDDPVRMRCLMHPWTALCMIRKQSTSSGRDTLGSSASLSKSNDVLVHPYEVRCASLGLDSVKRTQTKEEHSDSNFKFMINLAEGTGTGQPAARAVSSGLTPTARPARRLPRRHVAGRLRTSKCATSVPRLKCN